MNKTETLAAYEAANRAYGWAHMVLTAAQKVFMARELGFAEYGAIQKAFADYRDAVNAAQDAANELGAFGEEDAGDAEIEDTQLSLI